MASTETDADRQRREVFVEELLHSLIGQQAAQGISIPFPDLLIGVTALHLGLSIATLNVHHFQSIPGLSVVPL